MPHIMKDKKKYGGGSAPGPEYTAGDGIVIENDEISVDGMPAEDMDEIVTPKPSVRARYQKYSTEEQVVGEWINGKPLYQKTYNYASSIVIPADNTSVIVKIADITSLNISELISIKGSGLSSGGNQLRPLPDAAPIGNEGNYWMLSSCYVDDLDKGLYVASRRTNNTSVTLTNVKLTIQYTKSTD